MGKISGKLSFVSLQERSMESLIMDKLILVSIGKINAAYCDLMVSINDQLNFLG